MSAGTAGRVLLRDLGDLAKQLSNSAIARPSPPEHYAPTRRITSTSRQSGASLAKRDRTAQPDCPHGGIL